MEPFASPLFRAYSRMYQEENTIYHNIARHLGLSDAAFSVLYAISELEEGCLQRDICRLCFLSKQTVHSAVRKLEREGLLRLEPGKRRDVHLYLTPTGREAVERTILPVVQREIAAFQAMDQQDQAELVRLTRTYLDHLRDKTADMI